MERERLKAILQTLTGELPVREACRRLSVGESRFHEIRKEVLQAAVGGLRPRRTGRPPAEETEESAEIRRLSRRIEDLEAELQLSWLRSEIAVTMPHLLDRPERVEREKKGSSPKRRRKRRRP
jgi:hypothetical protein